MALTVEDGTGLANADAYISLTEALTYATDYGLTDWTAAGVTDPKREVAIRQATEYIDTVYVPIADRLVATQKLQFPIEQGVVPVALKFATARLAVFALNSDLAPFQTQTGIKSQRQKLGDLEQETVYESPSVNMPVFSYVDAMLRGLYVHKRMGGGSAGVYR